MVAPYMTDRVQKSYALNEAKEKLEKQTLSNERAGQIRRPRDVAEDAALKIFNDAKEKMEMQARSNERIGQIKRPSE